MSFRDVRFPRGIQRKEEGCCAGVVAYGEDEGDSGGGVGGRLVGQGIQRNHTRFK